jgi:hypothetical protein
MKAFRLLSAISCLAISSGVHVLAQTPPVPPAPPLPEIPAVAPVPPPPLADGEFREIERTVERAQREAAKQLASAQAARVDAQKALGKIKAEMRWMTGSKASRVLIVPADEAEPETIAHMEEDLAVMGRIIEKSVDSKERQPKALGIDVLTFAGPAGAQHLYVGGHGAIFTLRVKFPLSAPATETADREPDKETSSAWEDARRDIFGSSERHAFKDFAFKDQEDYDEDKVEQLKSSLIESLKHGTHIRHLKPDERVTVVVTSGGSGLFESRVGRAGYGGYGTAGSYARSGDSKERRSSRVVEVKEKGRLDSVLTIQAKKSDIDAFAKGTLDADAFRKKVTVMTY